MTDNELQIANIQRQIQDAQDALALGKALHNLASNPDFKKVISEGYLKHEAVRLVHLRADPELQSPAQQAAILRDIDSIGVLAEYLRVVRKQGEIAERSIADGEAAIAEIEEEEAELKEGN